MSRFTSIMRIILFLLFFLGMVWLAFSKEKVSAATTLLQATASPVSQSGSPPSTANNASGGIDSILAAALIAAGTGIIAAAIAAAVAIYQTRRNTQLQQDLLRFQYELEAQKNAKEQEEQREKESVEQLRLATQIAQTTQERVALYRKSLQKDPRIAFLQILMMNSPLNVTNIYIRVRLHEEVRPGYQLDPALLPSEQERDPNALIKAGYRQLEQKRSGALEPEAAIRDHRHCVIVGDPGAGKTTLLKYLALKSACHQLPGLPDLPIHVSLSDFVNSEHRDLLDFAAEMWEKRYGFPKEYARSYMDEQLQQGQALVLLDALDETVTGATVDAAEAAYTEVSVAIVQVKIRYSQAPIVITARKAGYFARARLVGFIELEVLDFRQEDIDQFIEKWFASTLSSHHGSAADLIDRLRRNARIQELAANPLLLSLIVLVYQAQLDLPDRRTELYKRCVDILLSEWDSSRGIQRRRQFKPEYKHQLLEEVAWQFHQHGQRYFPEQDLCEVIADFLPTVGLSVEENDRILDEIASENGLLKEQAQEWYGFLHLTLQEYFVARYVTDHQEIDLLLTHRHDAWWEEVLFLYAGQAPDTSSLFRTLLGYDQEMWREDLFHMDLLLAGRCLAARPRLRQPALRKDIVQRVMFVLRSTSYWLTQEQCVQVLVIIGGKDTHDALLQLLGDKQLDSSIRVVIAGALGNLGERTVAPDLMALLHDGQLDLSVLRTIAGALGNLGERTVAPELVMLLYDGQLDLGVRGTIAGALGNLGERAVASELVMLLRDEQLDSYVRGIIAGALGNLGERTVAPELVMLLRDEQLDSSVRRAIAGTLGNLGERAVVSELVMLLRDEQLDSSVRVAIAEALGNLGERAVAADLVILLRDEQLGSYVRRAIAGALGNLGERAVVRDLVTLLRDEQPDSSVRGAIARALGSLGERAVAADLVILLRDEQLDSYVRRAIAGALGILGERAVVRDLVALLRDKQLDSYVRGAIAGALGNLGERAVVPDLMTLLRDEQLDSYMRRTIAEALGNLGERTVAADLVVLLCDSQLDLSVRVAIAETLGNLGERAVASDLVTLLRDEQLDPSVRVAIAGTLKLLLEDLTDIRIFATVMLTSDIANAIHRALYAVCRQLHLRVFLIDDPDGKRIEVVPYDGAQAQS